jgi:hypothetical protein
MLKVAKFYSYAEPNMQNEREMRSIALFPSTGKEIDDQFHSVIDSSSRPIKQWRAQRDLCDRSNWCDWGNTKIDSITREVTVGSLLWAVTGTCQVSKAVTEIVRRESLHMAGFSALVASLASNVERSSVWCTAIPRDVAELPTSIALHGLSLTVTSKMVWSTALVASSRTGSTSKSTTGGKSASISTTRSTNTTARTRNTGWASWAWARTLDLVSTNL